MLRPTAVALVATAVLALSFASCTLVGAPLPSGDPVYLLTGSLGDACLVDNFVGPLVVDPKYGTAIRDQYGHQSPVVWPPGFTGRRVGSEVVVTDPNGNVVATTGHSYNIGGGFTASPSWPPELASSPPFWACGQVSPQ